MVREVLGGGVCNGLGKGPSALRYHARLWERGFGRGVCNGLGKGPSALRYHARLWERGFGRGVCNGLGKGPSALRYHARLWGKQSFNGVFSCGGGMRFTQFGDACLSRYFACVWV